MAAQQYDSKDIKAFKTPFYTKQSVNDTDTQKVALLSFTWHRQHINIYFFCKVTHLWRYILNIQQFAPHVSVWVHDASNQLKNAPLDQEDSSKQKLNESVTVFM